jgi:hypothetical protein
MKKAVLIILICFILTCFQIAFAIELKVVRAQWGTGQVSGNLDQNNPFSLSGPLAFKFLVETIPYDNFKGAKVSKKTLWGWDVGTQRYAIKRFEFTVGGKSVHFPKESYQDLGNVHVPYGLSVEKEGDIIYLIVKGGDGVYGYDAHFSIKDMKLIERRIPYPIKDDGTRDVQVKKFE